MTNKTTKLTTNAGLLITILTSRDILGSNMRFRITAFKMSDEYAKANKVQEPVRDLQVEVFDQSELEWKQLLKTGDFSGTDIEAFINYETLEKEVMDFIISYFFPEAITSGSVCDPTSDECPF